MDQINACGIAGWIYGRKHAYLTAALDMFAVVGLNTVLTVCLLHTKSEQKSQMSTSAQPCLNLIGGNKLKSKDDH
ncbi:hypothetical protein BDV3_000578 [Batrachochytrium dendrobatidis]|nr:hypothetical protein QVD99_007967 [Batrachochytrium dendrobatidis]